MSMMPKTGTQAILFIKHTEPPPKTLGRPPLYATASQIQNRVKLLGRCQAHSFLDIREQDRIAFIVPFEVSALFQRLSYSHVPTVNHEDGGKPETGRAESERAAASKTMEAILGQVIKPGQGSDHTQRRTRSHDAIECAVQNQMSR